MVLNNTCKKNSCFYLKKNSLYDNYLLLQSFSFLSSALHYKNIRCERGRGRVGYYGRGVFKVFYGTFKKIFQIGPITNNLDKKRK